MLWLINRVNRKENKVKENEYIAASNKAKVTAALIILRDILPGEQYGIGFDEYVDIIAPLQNLQDNMFNRIRVDPEED